MEPVACIIHPSRDTSRAIADTVETKLGIATRQIAGIRTQVLENASGFRCVVSAFNVDGIAGGDLLMELERRGFSARVVFVGDGSISIPAAVAAMRSGAVNILEQPMDADELVDAVQQAIDLTQQDRDQIERRARARQALGQLSREELAVARLTVDGLSTTAIASRLNSSTRTVERRRQHVYEKTGATSAVGLLYLLRDSLENDVTATP